MELTKEEANRLFHEDYPKWIRWHLEQPGEYKTEEEAKVAANAKNAARTRDNFEYGTVQNKNGGWDVCVYSND